MSELLRGLRAGLAAWRLTLPLALVVVVVFTVSSITLPELDLQRRIVRAATGLEQQDSVFFTPFYGEDGVSTELSPAAAELAGLLHADQALSLVVNNVGNPEEFGSGQRQLLLMGTGLIPEILSGAVCSPAPCVSVGTAAENHRGELEDRFGLEHRTELPRGATLFYPSVGILKLDDYVVYHLRPDQLSALSEYELEEAIWRAVLVAPGFDRVRGYVEAAAAGNLYLTANRVGGEAGSRKLNGFVEVALNYTWAMLVVYVLVLFAIVLATRAILRGYLPEIRARLGAGEPPLARARFVVALCAFPTMVAPLVALAPLWLILGLDAGFAFGLVGILVLSSLVFSALNLFWLKGELT